MTRLDDCNPSLRQRIEQQITADLAQERERRAAAATLAEQTDAALPPQEEAPCRCDLCIDRSELEAASMLTPEENTKDSFPAIDGTGDKARS